MKKVVIFGITGSVGTQTVDVINHMDSAISIVGCTFNQNTNKMKEIYNNNKSIEYIYSVNNPIYNNVSRKFSFNVLEKFFEEQKRAHYCLIIFYINSCWGTKIIKRLRFTAFNTIS